MVSFISLQLLKNGIQLNSARAVNLNSTDMVENIKKISPQLERDNRRAVKKIPQPKEALQSKKNIKTNSPSKKLSKNLQDETKIQNSPKLERKIHRADKKTPNTRVTILSKKNTPKQFPPKKLNDHFHKETKGESVIKSKPIKQDFSHSQIIQNNFSSSESVAVISSFYKSELDLRKAKLPPKDIKILELLAKR